MINQTKEEPLPRKIRGDDKKSMKMKRAPSTQSVTFWSYAVQLLPKMQVMNVSEYISSYLSIFSVIASLRWFKKEFMASEHRINCYTVGVELLRCGMI